jgi:hypothetical protein
METPFPQPGARRAVPVSPEGALSGDPAAHLWACEQYDGLLWQLVGMAGSKLECRAFLRNP